MSHDRRHLLGRVGERLACDHLQRLGYEIAERNYRTRWGELDLVAFDGETLVFCEVKTRRAGGGSGGPFDALGPAKQSKVRKMAASWLAQGRERAYAHELRFDAIGVTVDATGRVLELEHLKGAF